MLSFMFYLCFFTLILGQFSLILRGGELNLYFSDVTVTVYALLGLLYALFKRQLLVSKYILVFAPFTFWAGISVFSAHFKLNSSEFLAALAYFLRWCVYLLAGVVTYNLIRLKILKVENVIYAVVFSGVVLAVFGLIQLVLLPDFTVLDQLLGWDPHKNRLAATFFDPNFVGAYFSMCLALVLHLWFKKKIPKVFLTTLLAFFSIALTLTFSRSAWLMFAVSVFIYGMFRSRLLLVSAVLIAFLAYFAVPRVQTRIAGITDPADSAHFRLISWRNSLKIAQDNLFLGVGFNAFRYAQAEYGFFDAGTVGGRAGAGSDSSILLVFATTGIIGVAFFVFGYLYAPISAFLRNKPSKIFLISFLIGLLVESQFINSLFYPQILWLWMIFLALAANFDTSK